MKLLRAQKSIEAWLFDAAMKTGGCGFC